MTSHMTPFDSVLIANRGEIACRIIRTAKSLGLRTIAVYSEADADAPHVEMADESFLLGPAPVADSYLNMERILTAAKETGAASIHPGYGFLSENAAFAKACKDAGIIFIGPEPEAIDLMGDKAKAKRRMIAANVPCVPGYQGEDQSEEALAKAAKEIGFPIMVKAAAGGGGRGMRLVESAAAFADAVSVARSEAENAFGSGELILERAIINPRHVEIQILADKHGHVIHLGERDCSVQRRHQKVLEEAPCPVMTPELRAQMGAVAVKAAKDINYVGAGTVEFLLDTDGAFYFLEMNTRLQVEHPVTEMVTGLDLVALQFDIAQGRPLALSQDDIALNGWAIEARLYAEDVAQNFLPASGNIDLWKPAQRNNIRTDSGIKTGGTVSPYYDPMLAKIIAHGKTRDEARRGLIKALKETLLFGVTTNREFLIKALEAQTFAEGKATTGFIEETFNEDQLAAPTLTNEAAILAAMTLYLSARDDSLKKSISLSPALLNWASATPIAAPYKFSNHGQDFDISIMPRTDETYAVTIGDISASVIVDAVTDDAIKLKIDGVTHTANYNLPNRDGHLSNVQLSVNGQDYSLENLHAKYGAADESNSAGVITAPMHGMLVETFVTEGNKVAKGDRLAILEAMKMQHELIADIDGTISAKCFDAGVQIDAGAVIMEIAPAS
ncbi:MAG: 3-methylcrotonyl-CoA carboxylase subunit alpha [Hyphococcus sp.]|nr:MAG: 3-methylcrotonyl-CoA carboxylase subunit alpha [Marinicaulis sp.]